MGKSRSLRLGLAGIVVLRRQMSEYTLEVGWAFSFLLRYVGREGILVVGERAMDVRLCIRILILGEREMNEFYTATIINGNLLITFWMACFTTQF